MLERQRAHLAVALTVHDDERGREALDLEVLGQLVGVIDVVLSVDAFEVLARERVTVDGADQGASGRFSAPWT